jgi:hypothetical protein
LFDAFSSREPVSTSLENAVARPVHTTSDTGCMSIAKVSRNFDVMM